MRGDIVFGVYGTHEGRSQDSCFGAFHTRVAAEAYWAAGCLVQATVGSYQCVGNADNGNLNVGCGGVHALSLWITSHVIKRMDLRKLVVGWFLR